MTTDKNNGVGYIRIKATSGGGAFPVEGAIVHIFGGDESGENGVLYSLRTDSSGQTPTVALSAPNISQSQVPGAAYPYAVYNAKVSKSGYRTVENTNIPVFPGITSLQNINLIPESEFDYLSPGYPDEGTIIINTPESPLQ